MRNNFLIFEILMTKTTIKNDTLGFVPQSRFENLRIRISNLFRASTNFIKSGVFRIYFRASISIIKFTSLTNFNISIFPSAPMH